MIASCIWQTQTRDISDPSFAFLRTSEQYPTMTMGTGAKPGCGLYPGFGFFLSLDCFLFSLLPHQYTVWNPSLALGFSGVPLRLLDCGFITFLSFQFFSPPPPPLRLGKFGNRKRDRGWLGGSDRKTPNRRRQSEAVSGSGQEGRDGQAEVEIY